MTKKADQPRPYSPWLERPSHQLTYAQAKAWVESEILGEHVLAPVAYDSWRGTLIVWRETMIKGGYLTAAALIAQLLIAGEACRQARTPESVRQVADLWVRCHNEAGVACEEC